jgi:hypothetical protein
MDIQVYNFIEELPLTLKLPVEKLNELNTQRLLQVFNKARAYHSNICNYWGDRCCEICHEYIGCDWENDVGKYARVLQNYKTEIKKILNGRENVEK